MTDDFGSTSDLSFVTHILPFGALLVSSRDNLDLRPERRQSQQGEAWRVRC